MNVSRQRSLGQLGLALLLSLGLAVFVFRGGWSLGFFLAVLLTEGVFLAWLQLPADADHGNGPVANMPLQIILALIVSDLGLCFLLYDNIPLKLLDTLVVMVLLAVQFLLGSRVFTQAWDEPVFWIEAALSCLARPWVCLPDFGRSLVRVFARPATVQTEKPAPRIVVRILLGLLLALPVLLISGSLLTAADPVFAQLFTSLSRFLAELSLNELFKILLTALIILPFIFSFLYSGFARWRILPSTTSGKPAIFGFRIDKIVLITFLTCINLLYLLFAVVQVTYLTGAFTAQLPDGLTYAEYARSGFFELAFVTVINLVLILTAVKTADRQGPAGIVLRIESLLLMVGSLVQWTSAMFRMQLYVETYGLTQLRFLVTAFMILLLVLIGLLAVREFQPRFPLFKTFAAVTLSSLLILNHVGSDAWIARHNVDRYLATGKIDANYFKELSHSAVPGMLQLTETADPALNKEISAQLLRRYAGSLAHDSSWRWQRLNVSEDRALRLIEANLTRLKDLNPNAAAMMADWRSAR